MGQKVNPIAFRLGINETWSSNWIAGKDYKKYLLNDCKIRDIIKAKFRNAAIAKIIISRNAEKTKVHIHAAKSGLIIGKKGAEIDKLRKQLEPFVSGELMIDVHEVKKADTSAPILAHGIAVQLEKRVAFRRAMRKAMASAMRGGAKGIKIACAGRLAGAEIARTEWYKEGRLRLHTLRSAVDYAYDVAHTTYGCIGIKVWVYNGERNSYRTPA